MNQNNKKRQLNINFSNLKLGEDVFEKIRYEVLYPFKSISEVLFYVILAKLLMNLMMLSVVIFSIKKAIGKYG